MPVQARLNVDAPLATTSRHNLLTGARVIEPGERFPLGGIAYNPHNYQGGHSFDPSCEAGPVNLEDGLEPTVVEWDPAAIYWGIKCENPTPADIATARQRAEAGLEVHRSHLIEELLWTNATAGTDLGALHPNVGLADAPATELNGGSPLGIVPAIAALLEALATSLKGVRGTIHVPPQALAYLDFYGNSVVVGNQIVPGSADHTIVAGSGYHHNTDPSGTPAPDGYAWFYATSQVEVRLGAVSVPDRGFVWTTNTVEVYAMQPVIVSWDRGAHYAVQVCLSDPGPECEAAGS